MTADRQAALVAKVWSEHFWDTTGDATCVCGWGSGGVDEWFALLAAHVAAEVVAALEAEGLLVAQTCGDWPAPCNHDPHHERTDR